MVYDITEIEVPGWLAGAGPYIDSLQAYVVVRGRSANARIKMVFWSANDGSIWDGPFDLTTEIQADGQPAQAAYSTVANFRPQHKYGVGICASTGTATESAYLSAVIAATWKS